MARARREAVGWGGGLLLPCQVWRIQSRDGFEDLAVEGGGGWLADVYRGGRISGVLPAEDVFDWREKGKKKREGNRWRWGLFECNERLTGLGIIYLTA